VGPDGNHKARELGGAHGQRAGQPKAPRTGGANTCLERAADYFLREQWREWPNLGFIVERDLGRRRHILPQAGKFFTEGIIFPQVSGTVFFSHTKQVQILTTN